ncbi:flagellar outer dynein arm-docking complex [Raphidocelis subcapitata]|uniref:Flagellar outer dynein arm-docking complex n=1 Tax=Raphidocelis subcapitata TaxID=307507 RepID=A0A2V0P6Y0_9CHLO|nr:flagellar outer dynein arm-docking complex [Raphidocelis subcapitata]|eukprot:GBF94682.1 flagellar outer dynein arm-docking complex [Raphidocelis subcapitata]
MQHSAVDATGRPGALTGGVPRQGGGPGDTLSHKSVIEKQRAAIEKLRGQNARLKEELLLENKFSVRPSNPAATIWINKLQDEADLYTRKIQLQKRKVLMLQQQEAGMKGTLGTSRATMGGINSAREKAVGLQKQITILENRLEKQYIKYNEAVTFNKQLREQIDNLRRERMMFEGMDAQLDRDLARLKREIADTITAANEAHAAKERALAEAQSLKLQAEREHAAFEEEFRQLTNIIEDDRRQRDMARAEEMAEREKRTQELLKSTEASAVARKKAVRSSWQIGFNKALTQNVSHERVRLYAEAFQKIQDATGISDIDDLVAAFASGEDTNLTLFNHVTELSEEVDQLELAIAAAKKEIESYTARTVAADSASASAAASVAARLQRCESEADAREARLRRANAAVEALKGPVLRLFNAIGCDTPAVREVVGSGELTDSNLLVHLGIVEQRANELLQAYALSKGPEAAAALQEVLRAQPAPPPGTRVVVEPPSTVEGGGGGAAAAGGGGAQGAAAAGTSSVGAGGGETGEGSDGEAEPLPDDVPLTRAVLQACVQRSLPGLLERSLRVKPINAHGGGGRGSARRRE